MRQPEGNNTDCGVCAPLSVVGTLLRVPRPGNFLSATNMRWVAVMVLSKDLPPIVRLPSLGELLTAVLAPLPAPQALLLVADLRHQAGMPDARM